MWETKRLAVEDLAWLAHKTPPGWFDASGLLRLANPDLSVSLYETGRYVGSAGLFQLWAGVYEAWCVLFAHPQECWGFVGSLTRALRLGQHVTQAHRLQAYSLASYQAGTVLATRLGFHQEGIMRRATPDQADMILFAKVRR